MFLLFLQGLNKIRSALRSSQKPTHYTYVGRSPTLHRSAVSFGREEAVQQSALWRPLHCGGRHRQLDLTSWVEFDLISFGTVSHTLNSSVNGVTILESYWRKTTLPLMLLSQADRAQSHTVSLCVFLSSLSP